MKHHSTSPRPLVLALLPATLLGGCASFSPDGGFGAIEETTRSQIQKDVVWSRDEDTRICIAAVEARHELRPFIQLGRPLPLRVGAAGKLLLAFDMWAGRLEILPVLVLLYPGTWRRWRI